MANPVGCIDEIRLNPQYAHHVVSEFENDSLKEESIPKIKRKTLLTSDLMKRMANESVLGNEVMPVNCRYLERTPHGYIVVIEEPPAMRTVTIHKSFDREYNDLNEKGIIEQSQYKGKYKSLSQAKNHSFRLAFPYVIFILYIDNSYGLLQSRVFVRPAQLSGVTDYLCKIPMTNISEAQTICLGEQGGQRQRSLSAAVSHVIMVFWSATFNRDYTYNYLAYNSTPILGNYLEWEYMSEKDPMFVYSAEWINYSNIKDQLHVTRRIMDDRRGKSNRFDFDDLSKLFYAPQDAAKEEKVTPKGRKTHKLFYDICQGIYIEDEIFLNVGDTIKLHNGDYAYIDTFIGFMDGGDVRYIGLEYKGKLMLLKYNSNSRMFLKKNIEDQRRLSEVTLPNGEVIKPDDIIIINEKGRVKYEKVKYIRKSRGGDESSHEVRLSNAYYFSASLNAKIFNIEEPEINGVKINKNDIYVVTTDLNTNPMTTGGQYKYHSIDIDQRTTSHIVVKFKCIDKYLSGEEKNIRLSSTARNEKIIHVNETRPMPKVFRIGRRLYNGSYDDETIANGAVAYNGRAFFQHNYNWSRPNSERLMELIDNNKFHIAGVDGDTTFEVGDKVIVANWKTPIDVLNVKTIYGFKVEEYDGKISFILADKNNNLTEVLYVENHRNGAIYTGRIRKVTNQFEKLSVGTKIIAKEAGIYCFPKKDVNIVVAIIIDGPFEPLVLCSNGCTLWYSDIMEKFTKVTMKAKRWTTLQHAPLDLSKIKFQAGDIITGQMNYTDPFGFVLSGEASRQLKATPLAGYSGHPDTYSFDRYFQADAIFDCIPAPRINPRVQGELGYKRGFLDFHGNCIIGEDNASLYKFINDRGI